MWYVLNCVAGLEMNLLRQCRNRCADMPDAVKFVVPTVQKTRSHGANRMVTESKVKYQGYVFAKIRLCEEVYEAIQGLDLCRSWMGTINQKGYKKLPPAPVALNELEVEEFGLEDIDDKEEVEEEDPDVIVDEPGSDDRKGLIDESALKVYLGLKVDNMVKVTARGKFYNEDGIIRRLKDGKIFVRFYTYGSMYEEWLEPGDVRKLSNIEILKGLSGPSQPISQRELDGPSQDRYDRQRPGPQSSFVTGQRNRRQDRTASQYDGRNRDFFGRTDDERRREERNWRDYQDKQRQDRGATAPPEGNTNMQSRSRDGGKDDWVLGDVDSQWGRKPQSQQRREPRQQRNTFDNRRNDKAIGGRDDWSAFVSPAQPPRSKKETDSEDFFGSLMKDISADSSQRRKPTTWPKKSLDKADEDSFFASLMSDLTDATGGSPARRQLNKAPKEDDTEDFFAALEAELGGNLDASDGGGNDDFFSQLNADLAQSLDAPIAEERVPPATPKKSRSAASNLLAAPARTSDVGDTTLEKRTVPELKDMLRERGLKVSGKKSELIDRLVSSGQI